MREAAQSSEGRRASAMVDFPAAIEARAHRIAVMSALDLSALKSPFERIGRMARALLGGGLGDVILINGDETWHASADAGFSRQIAAHRSFAGLAVESEDVMWVVDARLDPRFADHPYVIAEPFVRFFAGAPIRLADGSAVGAVVVAGPEVCAYDESLAACLRDLAAMAAGECSRHQAVSDLAQAHLKAQAAQTLMATFVETAPVALCLTDADMRIIQASHCNASETVEEVTRTAAIFEGITESMGLIIDHNTQIASAAEQQAIVVENVERNTLAIKSLSEANATEASHTVAVSGEVVSMTRELHGLIGQFKMK